MLVEDIDGACEVGLAIIPLVVGRGFARWSARPVFYVAVLAGMEWL